MRIVTLAIAGLLLFSGCSSDPKPIEPSPEPSPTSSVEAPRLPDGANADTPEGAGRFVRFWVDAFNYAALTGRSNVMSKYARHCKPCLQYAADFKNLKPSERPKGNAWKLQRVSVYLSRNPIEVETEVKVEGEAGKSTFTFVLNSHSPFEILNIYDRR